MNRKQNFKWNNLSLVVCYYPEHWDRNLIGWQIDNELNCEINEYYSESDNLAFRKFLIEKYKTLDALNEAWGTVFWNQNYNDWNQVFVPRTTINDMVNPHLKLDFIRFISESAIRYCRMQSDILRLYVKEGDFITTNGMFSNLDNHKMQDTCLDVYTYDSYPNFAYCMKENPRQNGTLNDRKWSRNLMEVRSICPHFGIMEQQSGANGWNTLSDAPAPKPGQMMLWTMQSIMHGADYVSFFRWRTVTKGTEMYWHGILDYDNILDTQLDIWHGRIADSSEMEIFVASQLKHTPMDSAYIRENTQAEELKKYKVLIYPHAEILTEKTVGVLEDYVHQGGCLIIGARTGQKDRNGQCVMKQMLGILAPLTQSEVKEFTLIGPDDDVFMN